MYCVYIGLSVFLDSKNQKKKQIDRINNDGMIVNLSP